MPPEILKSALLEEWYIVTRKYTDKHGITTMTTKHPIPREVLKQIAYDWLIKEAKDCEKGYTFELTDVLKNEKFRITVERVKEGEQK